MADNTVLNAGNGGDTIRDVSKGGIKTSVCIVDIGGGGTEALLAAGQAVMASSVPVVIASNQSAVPASQSGSWTVTANAGSGTLAVSAASLPLPTGASTAAKQPALGTAGTASTDVLSVQGIASMTPLLANIAAAATGGGTPYKLISGASTNATSVKASAGVLDSVAAFNVNASARFVKFYNKASSPTVGSDTPVFTLVVPGNAAGSAIVLPFPKGVQFTTGIAFAITGAMPDADTTSISAGDVVLNLNYT